MDDEDISRILGLVVAALALGAAWRWAKAQWHGWSASSATSPGIHGPGIAGQLWHDFWWFPVGLVLLLVTVKAASWWLRRRAEQRRTKTEILAARIGRVMPAGWKADEHLKIKSWDGMSPRRVLVHLVPACETESVEWRKALVKASGIAARPNWDKAITKRWVELVAAPAEPAATDEQGKATAVEVDTIETALSGLVPGVGVERSTNGLVISYGETTRDQSVPWQQRVVDQVSNRTGTRWRASWDRQRRTITLTSVPQLPRELSWWQTYDNTPRADQRMVPYGIDESGYLVCWEAKNKGGQPHAIIVGETGSGKTETIKSIVNSWLLMGGLVIIGDPKQQDFAEYLGRPGVIAVATSIEDRAAMLRDVMREVHRRNAGIAARKLLEDHPELADMADVSALTHVPLLVVMDELTQHSNDLAAWWAELSGDERAALGGNPKSSKPTEIAGLPSQIAQLARAGDVHLLVGMQRGDASNFGDSTAMRENLSHIITMAATSAISSEMVWGDRHTGSRVEINGPGEGMSNGARLETQQGHTVQLGGTPGRFKSMYVGTESRDAAFWERVAKVAPSVDLVPFPSLSRESVDPAAALERLLVKAGVGSGADQVEWPVAKAWEAGVIETDTAGITWVQVPATDLQVGDVVSFGDVVGAEVLDVEGWVRDDFDGSEVFRVVLSEDGLERCVDLSGDELVERRM